MVWRTNLSINTVCLHFLSNKSHILDVIVFKPYRYTGETEIGETECTSEFNTIDTKNALLKNLNYH